MRRTIPEALVEVLRQSGITGIAWGPQGSPYYDEVPEPPPAFPFVVLELPESETEYSFEEPYAEKYQPTVHVVGEQEQVTERSTPYGDPAVSVVAYLDGLRQKPAELNGDGFECIRFTRAFWTLKLDRTARAPDGGRVWVASARYDLWVIYGG